MRIAMFPAPSGSAFWRLIDPAKYMRKKGFEVKIADKGINEDIAQWADVYVLENCVNKEGIALLYTYQQERGKKIVSDWDDFIYSNESSPHKKIQEITDFPEVSKVVLKISDMVTVTTDYLKNKYSEYNKNIEVLDNFMDMDRWDKPKKENKSKKIKIGWAGSLTHYEDLAMIAKPLKKVMREFPSVQLVIVGDTRFKEMFKGYNVETMFGVPFEYWPDKLNGLQWDIGIAPLVDNEFNRCKSNIKWQEYSIAKIPGIYSPIVYEKTSSHVIFDGKIGMTANSEKEWYMCLRNYIVCKNLRKDVASRAYSFARMEYDLEKNIYKWLNAYLKLTQ
jgi:glycosyltransferase involved in cell wall biosynthesis